jgi:hypothetical protein
MYIGDYGFRISDGSEDKGTADYYCFPGEGVYYITHSGTSIFRIILRQETYSYNARITIDPVDFHAKCHMPGVAFGANNISGADVSEKISEYLHAYVIKQRIIRDTEAKMELEK